MAAFLPRNLLFPIIFICLSIAGSTSAQTPLIDSLQSLLKNAPTDSSKVVLLNDLSKEYLRTNTEKALTHIEEAIELARSIGDSGGLASAYNILGVYHENFSEYANALLYYNKSLDTYKRSGDKDGMATEFNNIGNVHSTKGEYSHALEYLFQSLKTKEDLNDELGMANAYNNIGIIHSKQKNYNQALEYYFKSIEAREVVKGSDPDNLHNIQGLADIYINIGVVYYYEGDYDEVLEYFFKAMKIFEDLQNKKKLAITYSNIGEIYSAQNRPNKSLDYKKKALKMQEAIGDIRGSTYSLNGIGITYIQFDKADEAIPYFERSIEASRQIGTKPELSEAYSGMAKAYAHLKDFEKAYEYRMLYTNLKDSLFTEKNTAKIAEMEAKYETEKKELLISSLEKEKTQQAAVAAAQQTIIWSVVGGLTLVIVFAGFLFNRFQVTKRQKAIIEAQKQQVDQAFGELSIKTRQITDSINYAKRIQEAMLPSIETIESYLPESFVLYKPKDVVSGDFYWAYKKNDAVLFAAVDCTGHGVPGAFMSIIGINLLNDLVSAGVIQPNEILKKMKQGVIKRLKQNHDENEARDGMDMALCNLNFEKMELQYAGARNSLYLIRNKELREYKADKTSVGIGHESEGDDFTNHSIKLEKGDCLYMFSDGFADQKGGIKGKKFYYAPFQQLLMDFHTEKMSTQMEKLDAAVTAWKGDREQMDDILVFGVRV